MTEGWWLPADLRHFVEDTRTRRYTTPEHGPFDVEMPHVSPTALGEVARGLRRRAEKGLRRRPIAEIVDRLDEAAGRWLDPSDRIRRAAIESIPKITGHSPEMVTLAIELEQRSSRGDHLMACLRSEIGDPEALDRFRPARHLGGGGESRAVGPGLVGAVFSANIPALPHLTIMRALLVKASCLGRSSAGEPAFLPLYLRSLEEIDAELAAALGVLWWERGDEAHWSGFFDETDFVVAYGGSEAERELRGRMPAGLPLLYHGHRLGVAIVDVPEDGEARDDLAARLAYDATVFDQHACLSPHAVLALGSFDACAELGEYVGRQMEKLRVELPPRILEPARAAALSQLRGVAEISEALGSPVRLLTPADGSSAWTVLVEEVEGMPISPLDRFLRIVPHESLDAIVARVRPARRWLQNVAVELGEGEDDAATLREDLARLGATRICAPGQMATPSMMWHHDGQACVGAMVRWCDREVAAP